MINIYSNSFATMITKQKGAALLVTTLLLFVLSSLIVLYAGNQGKLFSQAAANTVRADQAFEAAEAGLEFGISYLRQNKATILASASGGYINYSDSNTTDVVLSNGSQFSVTYTNPTANNYDLITITSVGTNADGSSTRTIQQQVQHGSYVLNPPSNPIVTQGSVSMSGAPRVNNPEGTQTILSASSVDLQGGAKTTVGNSVSSTSHNIQSDIDQNNTSVGALSSDDFFATYFGTNQDIIKQNMTHYYSNNASTNYSATLDGMSNTSIWIDQTAGTASLSGNISVGTATNPVLLVVNGDLSTTGSVTIYGFVFVLGEYQISFTSGNADIIGNILTTGPIGLSGSIEVTFDSSVINTLQNSSITEFYAKVPGSWRDF